VKEDINIEELFQQKFSNFEGNVSPDAWANISQAIGSTTATTAVTGGLSTLAKVAIISGGIVVASVAGVLIYNASTAEEEVNNNESPIEEVLADADKNEPVESEVVPLEYSKNNELIVPEDIDDSAIENNVEEIVEAMKENEVEEMTVSEETVKEILSGKIAAGMMFNTILSKEKNTTKKNAHPSETNIVVAGTEKKDGAETVNEEIKVEDVEIVEIEEIEIDETEKEIEQLADARCVRVPNIFTPNGDFKNDFWTVETTDLKVFVLELRDSKGEVVFTTSDKEFEWDGTNVFGERVDAGVYNYIIVTERASNGKKLVTQGSVTVTYK
jgi:gliding motility-associated-like protein